MYLNPFLTSVWNLFDQLLVPFNNPQERKTEFTIRRIQKGVGGAASTIIPTFIVLKTVRINKQDINNNSTNKLFQRESKSLIEHEILNKKPIPKFITTTTSLKPQTKSSVSYETYGTQSQLQKATGLEEDYNKQKVRDPMF